MLPWREELRKVRNRVFYATGAVSVILCVGLMMLGSLIMQRIIEVRTANIAYIDKALLGLKGKIAEIKGLQENKKQLLERMEIINALQTDRFTIVKLLDLLPRILPDGIYLTEVNRQEEDMSTAMPGLSQPNNTSVSYGTVKEQTASFLKGYRVEIKGVALTNGSVSVFLKNLGNVKWISGIKLNEVAISKEKGTEGFNFQIECIELVTTDR